MDSGDGFASWKRRVGEADYAWVACYIGMGCESLVRGEGG